MATSSDATIQQLTQEAEALDGGDENLEEKLQRIAEAVAARQAEVRGGAGAADGPVDPQDAFACESCQ